MLVAANVVGLYITALYFAAIPTIAISIPIAIPMAITHLVGPYGLLLIRQTHVRMKLTANERKYIHPTHPSTLTSININVNIRLVSTLLCCACEEGRAKQVISRDAGISMSRISAAHPFNQSINNKNNNTDTTILI
jgi:hypothetical protein